MSSSKKKGTYKQALRNKVQSARQLKVAQLINYALFKCIQKGSSIDLRLMHCPLTITKVTMSSDLRFAYCFFLPFNTQFNPNEILDALNLSKVTLRRFINKEVSLKYSPQLRFYHDLGFEDAVKIDQILNQRSCN
mgnify:CR=1 FL=1